METQMAAPSPAQVAATDVVYSADELAEQRFARWQELRCGKRAFLFAEHERLSKFHYSTPQGAMREQIFWELLQTFGAPLDWAGAPTNA